MTALVGILNRRAVAIAADSAVTVSNKENTKIYNTSQKIFKLSEKNPVAIMMYSRAEFMNAPWDVIIDMYRSERGDKTFKKVKDYAEDFLKYISECDFFTDPEEQKEYLIREMLSVYRKITGAVEARAEDEIAALDEPSDEQIAEIRRRHFIDAHSELEKLCDEYGKVEGLKDFTYKQFAKHIEEQFKFVMTEILEENWDEEEKEVWMHSFHNFLTSKFFYNETGLVFVGYGSKDFYPALYSVFVSGIFNDCLRWIEDDDDSISSQHTSWIQPYAQTDVMHTMMKGISPVIYEELQNYHRQSLSSFKEKAASAMQDAGASDKALEKLEELDMDEIQNEYVKKVDDYVQDNYIQGVLDAVESFNVEDMANMAESLISITNLQRHFSSSEESVGGPVEVAVITRSGGFKWVKHRQW